MTRFIDRRGPWFILCLALTTGGLPAARSEETGPANAPVFPSERDALHPLPLAVDLLQDVFPRRSARIDDLLLASGDQALLALLREGAEAPRGAVPEAAARERALTALLAAEEAFRAGRHQEGLRSIDRALDEAPFDPFVLQRAAVLSGQQEQFESALSLYRRAALFRREEGSAALFAGWAAASWRLGQTENAALLLDHALQLDPGNLAALYLRSCLRAHRREPPAPPGWGARRSAGERRLAASWLAHDESFLRRLLSEDARLALWEAWLGETGPPPNVEPTSVFHYLERPNEF